MSKKYDIAGGLERAGEFYFRDNKRISSVETRVVIVVEDGRRRSVEKVLSSQT